MWRLSVLAFLIGCDEYGLKTDFQDTALPGTESGDCSFCIISVDPSSGPLAGGTAVTITGNGFTNGARARFGGVEIDVTHIDEQNIAITSPPSFVEGPVDVTVWTAEEQTKLSSGFTYTDSPPQDTQDDTDSGNDTDNENDDTDNENDTGGNDSGGNATGLTGGLIELSLQVDPYQLISTQGYLVYTSAMLHTPTSGSWLDWITSEGTCSPSVQPQVLSTASEQLGNWTYLTTGAVSINLQQVNSNGVVTYSADNLSSDVYIKGAGYTFSAPEQGIEIPNAVVTPMGLGNFGPIEYFSAADPFTNIFTTATTFTWEPDSDVASTMWFIVENYDSTGTQLVANFQCNASDTGMYQIPANMFINSMAGDILVIQMYRIRKGSVLHPQNGSTIESFSMTGGLGIAIYY